MPREVHVGRAPRPPTWILMLDLTKSKSTNVGRGRPPHTFHAKLFFMAVENSTQRFSSRVGNYVRYRPSYPSAVIDLLKNECGLTPAAVIADIASGTGIFTRMLLENGNRVFGVEPNAEMRHAAEDFLRSYSHFT